MKWLRAHPSVQFTMGIVIVGLFLLAFRERTSAPLNTTYEILGNTPGDYYANYAETPNAPAKPPRQTPATTPHETFTYTLPTRGATAQENTFANPSFDLATFKNVLAQSAPHTKPVTVDTTPPISPALLALPAFLQSVSPSRTRTAEQQALFDYGNSAGALIQSFDNAHNRTTDVLKRFFDNRTDASTAEPVLAIARDYADLSAFLANVQAPPVAESKHRALIDGYKLVSEGFLHLTQMTNDKDFLDAVFAYNKNADAFIKNQVGLIQMFSAYGVTFSASDPGSIFSFNPSGF